MKTKISLIIAGLMGFIFIMFVWRADVSFVKADTNSSIYAKAQSAQNRFLATLKTIVNIDSGTGDKEGITKVENMVIQQLKSLKLDVKTSNATGESVGRNIIATMKGTGKKSILLLAHSDTVFKKGDVKEHPFTIENGKAKGLGVMDDKGGILLGIEAMRILQEINFKNFEKITFLINPDEETGSKGSRDLIKEIAKQHDFALVLEFGSPEDTVTLWRKGIGYYGFTVTGKSAHAGSNPEDGCNALMEASYQVIQLNNKLNNPQHTTVNFTVFKSGDRPNIIPDQAEVQADVRVLEMQEYERLKQDFERITQNKLLDCTKIKIKSEQGRPPFSPNSKTNELIKKAQGIYQEIKLKLHVKGSGAGTDGNYAASVGTATLDALGPVGDHAHNKDEYIKLDRISPRIYLLTRLLMDLGMS